MSKSYELFLHYKQGDDFANCLEKTENDIPAALQLWEQSFKENAAVCKRLAKALEGQRLTVCADTHHISFEPVDAAARTCLEVMAKEDLIQIVEFEDDEDEELDDEEDEDDKVKT